ncbi:uncharacterized protein F5Z01DRAFT_361718 [Emericellopsis atlantica]|uniref:F-box domain-containing protein n=1 Tax=Emericellopsis atlantica TaxID=2614577 RepID=A0A9P8CM93_9HYPO|nr:uncharacterized protein F5Z01DRAFT_361718 [Emericellopsis atlantica]KAG9250441.1 hypothetical protein F5Z01DRAFT_361718 [Emericellopsis atlantica]
MSCGRPFRIRRMNLMGRSRMQKPNSTRRRDIVAQKISSRLGRLRISAPVSEQPPVPVHFDRPTQPPAAQLITKLPVELIKHIISHLDDVSKALLSQVSKLFEVLLSFTYPVEKWPKADRSRFLACLTHDKADRWVCEDCMRSHAVNFLDLRHQPELCNCPWLRRRSFSIGAFDLQRLWPPLVDGRHVQLALKYVRLRPALSTQQEHHLSRLLSSFMGCMRASSPGRPTHSYKYQLFPRIVHSRFMLKVVYEFPPCTSRCLTSSERLEMAEDEAFVLNICPHQSLMRSVQQRYICARQHEVGPPPTRSHRMWHRGWERDVRYFVHHSSDSC